MRHLIYENKISAMTPVDVANVPSFSSVKSGLYRHRREVLLLNPHRRQNVNLEGILMKQQPGGVSYVWTMVKKKIFLVSPRMRYWTKYRRLRRFSWTELSTFVRVCGVSSTPFTTLSMTSCVLLHMHYIHGSPTRHTSGCSR